LPPAIKRDSARPARKGPAARPTNANPDNQGQTTITGPRGQVKQGKDANTTVDLPGSGR